MENNAETDAVCLVYSAYRKNMATAGLSYDKPLFEDMHHWARTAKLVIRHNIDPVRFVNAQFMVVAETIRTTLTPRMLHDPVKRALNAYLSVCPDPCDYTKGLEMMRGRLRQLARGAHSEEEVLADPDNTFPAWFRIAAAPEMTDRLRSRYMDAAEREYTEDMRLRNFLKKENLDGRFASFGGRSGIQ